METTPEIDTKFQNSKRAKASTRLVTIEPIVFLTMVYFGNSSWNGQYLQRRIATEKYNYSLPNISNASCLTNTSDPDYIIQQTIQSDASQWTLYLGICNSLPGMVATVVTGALSDVYGRKIALGSPVLGCALQGLVNMMVVVFHLPLEVLLIGSVILGVSGGYPLLMAGCMAYIADVTTEKQRTFRVTMIDTTLLVAMASSELAMGYLIDAAGFLAPTILLLGLQILCLMYIFIPKLLLETIHRDRSASVSDQIATTCSSIRRLFKVNTYGRRWKLLLIATLYFVLEMVLSGYMSVIVLYSIGEPFCWTSIQVGYFLSITLLVHATCSAIAAKLLPKFISDAWILHVCLASLVAWTVLVSLAKTSTMLYVSSFVGCLGSLAPPVVKSMTSKIIDSHEQGVMFSLMLSAVGAAEFVGPIVLTYIYSVTVFFSPPLVFYVTAGVTTIPVILTCIFQSFTRHPHGYKRLNIEDIIDNEENEEAASEETCLSQ